MKELQSRINQSLPTLYHLFLISVCHFDKNNAVGGGFLQNVASTAIGVGVGSVVGQGLSRAILGSGNKEESRAAGNNHFPPSNYCTKNIHFTPMPSVFSGTILSTFSCSTVKEATSNVPSSCNLQLDLFNKCLDKHEDTQNCQWMYDELLKCKASQ